MLSETRCSSTIFNWACLLEYNLHVPERICNLPNHHKKSQCYGVNGVGQNLYTYGNRVLTKTVIGILRNNSDRPGNEWNLGTISEILNLHNIKEGTLAYG